MDPIQYNDEPQFAQAQASRRQSLLVRMVLATGLASTESGAQYVLLAIAVIAAALAVAIYFLYGQSPAPAVTPYA